MYIHSPYNSLVQAIFLKHVSQETSLTYSIYYIDIFLGSVIFIAYPYLLNVFNVILNQISITYLEI
jgi:hypothetical protein